MVLMHWFERGLGQFLAPDENYKSNPDELDTRSSFWSWVAPDENFQEKPAAEDSAAATPLTAAVSALMQSPQPMQSSEAAGSIAFSPCRTCMNKLCAHCSRQASASGLDNATPSSSISRTIMPSSLRTPRRQTPVTDPHVESGVLSAAKGWAEAMKSPPAMLKNQRKVLKWCANNSDLSPKLQGSLSKLITNEPTLLLARSSNLGLTCPDGYTPFMAAAYANHVVAARILWDFVEASEDNSVITKYELLREVNLQGETALHIASEKGNEEMVKFLQAKYIQVFGMSSPPPVDLLGRTPLGSAFLSSSKAKRVAKALLYSDTDVSVRGTPLAPKDRESSNTRLRVAVGTAEMPGKRIRMEDYVVCDSLLPNVTLVAVADGHEDLGLISRRVAEYLVTVLNKLLSKHVPTEEAEWQEVLQAVFADADDVVKASKLNGGSAAILVVLTERQIVVANAGDCRCILVQKKNDSVEQLAEATEKLSLDNKKSAPPEWSAKALSMDHKPNLPEERARIEGAGLTISAESYVEGGETHVIHKIVLSENNRVAMSRAFGDFEYKANGTLEAADQAITAVPEVTVHTRTEEDAFLVAACDGVWDVMSNDDVAQFVADAVKRHLSNQSTDSILPTVGDELLEACLKRGTDDNMSVAVVALSKMAEQVQELTVPPKALHFT